MNFLRSILRARGFSSAKKSSATSIGDEQQLWQAIRRGPLKKKATSSSSSSSSSFDSDSRLMLRQTTAYCTAASYDLHRLRQTLVQQSPPFFSLQMVAENVLHVKMDTSSSVVGDKQGDDAASIEAESSLSSSSTVADCFVFSADGAIVLWNASSKFEQDFLALLRPHERESYSSSVKEWETMDYYEHAAPPAVRTVEDMLLLDATDDNSRLRSQLTFSYALARSVRVSVYEAQVDALIDKIKGGADTLVHHSLPFSPQDRRTRTTVLSHLRDIWRLRSVYLTRDLNTIPDYFWEEPLLEQVYEQTTAALDLQKRIHALNERLQLSHELIEMLRIQLNESYSHRLEWLIIVLIAIEIVQAALFPH